MPAQEIPREEWPRFCDSFTRQHRGVLATIVIARPGEPLDIEVSNLPLQDVSLDTQDENSVGVYIMVGKPGEGRLTHFTAQVTRLLFDMSEAGEHAGLTLEGADGVQTRVRFRVPFLPETLDGLMITAGVLYF